MMLSSVLIAVGILSVFAGLVGTGLWLAFLGWFLASAARAELADTQARHVLDGVRIDTVMTPHPVTVLPSMSLERLVTDVLSHVRGSAIPVVADDRLPGLVTPDHLRLVPPSE